MHADGNRPVLEVRGITKRFPGVLANDDVSLTLHKGEILALLGENGAGKSTLMNIIYGLYRADSGEVLLNGQPVHFASSREAIHSGIGMVHQHFQLIPVMTVAENVVLGEEVMNGIFLDRQEAARRVHELSERYGLEVNPAALVEELPVGAQQRVEIVKALYRDAQILILDEPTAVLTPQEVQELFKIMRDLSARGVSIIFITHKLKEVLAVAHRIVVMRDGRVVGETNPLEATEESLAAMMVGREVLLRVKKGQADPKGVVLRVDGLSAYDDRGHMALRNVSFEVRAGEVLGIAGVQGNGQTELVEVLTGLRRAHGGRFSINHQDMTHATPRDVTVVGAGHVPEDRHRYGMVTSYSVSENLVLNTYFQRDFTDAPTNVPTILLASALYGFFAVTSFGLLWLVWSLLWDGGEMLAQFLQRLGVAVPWEVTSGGGLLWPLALRLFNVADPANAGREVMAGPDLVRMFLLIIAALLIGWVAARIAQWIMAWLRVRFSGQFERLHGGQGGVVLNRRRVDAYAERLVKEFGIRTPSVETSAGSLSGGNQQKMVVARELGRRPALLIASQPTRGIDVGSIEFIHQQLVAQRDAGAAVLLVSAELDEIMALSDRIAVMYKGEIVATVPAGAVTREQLGLLMAGAHAEEVLQAA